MAVGISTITEAAGMTDQQCLTLGVLGFFSFGFLACQSRIRKNMVFFAN